MPGAGKSSVGRQLARRLNHRFVDSDAVIEERCGEPIRAIFERDGEPHFRDIEQNVIAELASMPQGVIGTGGGAVLREANRSCLRQATVCIYLRSTPHELIRRLRYDTRRPLLQVRDPLAKLHELYAQRDPLYREAAHFVMETGRPSMQTLVNMILMQLELADLVPASAARSPVDAGPLQGE